MLRRHGRAKVTNITVIHWSPSRGPEPESCQVTTFFLRGQSTDPAGGVPAGETRRSCGGQPSTVKFVTLGGGQVSVDVADRELTRFAPAATGFKRSNGIGLPRLSIRTHVEHDLVCHDWARAARSTGPPAISREGRSDQMIPKSPGSLTRLSSDNSWSTRQTDHWDLHETS